MYVYRAGLSKVELVAEVHGLLATEREVEQLLCRYLADLADRLRNDMMSAGTDIRIYARQHFGMKPRQIRERVRVGRALRELPALREAFSRGALAYSKVREVTRVATPADEGEWIEVAQQTPIRALERRVTSRAKESAQATPQQGEGNAVEPDPPPLGALRATRESKSKSQPRGAVVAHPVGDKLRVTIDVTPEVWGLLQRALDGARQASETHLSPSELVQAVATDALAAQQIADATDASDIRRAVVLYSCHVCKRTELDAGREVVELDAAAAARLACGADHVDLSSEPGAAVCARRAAPDPGGAALEPSGAAVGGGKTAEHRVVAPSPDVAAPDVAAPDVAAPVVAAPDVAAPDVAAPDVAAPDVAAPDVAAPDVAAPVVATPDVAAQQAEMVPASVQKAVLCRDRFRCRAPGCSCRRYVEVHRYGREVSRSSCVTLCARHHREVHAGELHIEGNAEGELSFFVGETRTPVEARPTGGSSDFGEMLSPEAELLLRIMGDQRFWHLDTLIHRANLSLVETCGALLDLELSGHIVQGPATHYSRRAA